VKSKSSGKTHQKIQWISASLKETERIAVQFSKGLGPGDVVALSGGLGSGKTTFTKGLAKGLGVKDFIKSPTFNLMHIHQGRCPLYHFDFYRLDNPDLDVLGFEEYIYEGDGVAVLEWPEKIKEELPKNTLRLHLSVVSETKRKISLQ